MKKNILLSILTLFVISSFFSCKKDKEAPYEVEKPTIDIKEVGTNNNKIAYTGHDLHLDVEIKAPRKIASIKVQITLAETNYGWDFTKIYTEGYAGQKNADFHEHIDIPENAKTGKYDLLILVTDEDGNKSQAKTTFEALRDLSLPSASGIAIKLTGNSLNVKAQVTAQNKIAKISIEAQSSPWTKMFDFTDPDIVGQHTYALDKTMEVSPTLVSHYHVNIFITDQAGKSITYGYHFDK